jgi:hypothetical protein
VAVSELLIAKQRAVANSKVVALPSDFNLHPDQHPYGGDEMEVHVDGPAKQSYIARLYSFRS